MGRTPCCEKIGLKRGRWTAEEDEILINYIKQNGDGSWRSLPKNAGLLRCGKSCRLRWINYLRADLKRGNFSSEEEETIIKLHRSVGNKWSLIANSLPGRTDNEVKNYWNSHLSRKIYSFRSCNGSMVTTIDMIKMGHSTCKRKGGRVSRAVAKKYNMTTLLSKATTATTSSSSRKKMKIGATNGIHEEATTAENPEVGCSGSGSAEEIWKNDFLKTLENRDKVERERINSIPDFNFDGLEGCPGILMECAEKLHGENELLGRVGEPDDVTLLLDQILPVGLMDWSDISVHSDGAENVPMDQETALIDNEIDNTINLHPDNGNLYDCFSPLNSYFNHDSVTSWDAEYAVRGFKLWDDEGDDIIWQ